MDIKITALLIVYDNSFEYTTYLNCESH